MESAVDDLVYTIDKHCLSSVLTSFRDQKYFNKKGQRKKVVESAVNDLIESIV